MSKAKEFEVKVAEHLGLILPVDDPVWSDARYLLITGGWRAGKSTRGAFRAQRQILRPIEKGLIWLVGPDYIQTNEEFRYLLEWSNKLGIYKKHTMPTDGRRTLETKTGWSIETKSARYPERLGMVAPDGIVMCEPGQMSGEVYTMIMGRLMEKRGWLVMAGTLEDDANHTRWAWYEDMANEWLKHDQYSQEQAFCLPSWANTKIFPLGYDDPEIQYRKQIYSEYTFARRIAAQPVGVEHPCFQDLWDDESRSIYVQDAPPDMIDGAIGVDYGSSDEHPSASAVITVDTMGRHWIRDVWADTGGSLDQIVMVVAAQRKRFEVNRIRTDPNQEVLAQRLEGVRASGAGESPTEMRIGIANGLLMDRKLYFDRQANGLNDVFSSMRRMRRKRDAKGRLIYDREQLGDDEAMAVLYALEELRGNIFFLPEMEGLGGMKIQYGRLPSRAGLVGRT